MSTILDQIVHVRTVALKKYDVTCVLYCVLHKAKNFSFGLYCSKKCQFTYHKQYPNAISELKIIEQVKKTSRICSNTKNPDIIQAPQKFGKINGTKMVAQLLYR